MGIDGLTIRKGWKSGLLLPQVPGQFGWTRDEFLTHLCAKAGLTAESWREAEIQRFTAQIFGEEHE